MTAQAAMLADEVIEKAAIRHSDKEHSPFNSDARYHFKAGARFARDRYEARLAEDAKVRAGLVEALESAREWMIEEGCDCGVDEPESCALCLTVAALAAAKERG